MRIKDFLYLCYVTAIFSVASCVWPAAIHAQQYLPGDPSSPLAPTENSQCEAYSAEWRKLESDLERRHQECLDANSKNKAPRNPGSGHGVGSTCDYGSCQALHTRMYEVKRDSGPEIESCRSQVRKHQENERLKREAEEQRRREAEEQQERALAEQKEREARKREQADAEKQKRSDEAEERRKREDANRKLIELAAEQQRLEQEALARRTEERQRQMEELKKRQEETNDQYHQNVEKQTRDAQDDLLAQMRKSAGTENTVFPTLDSQKNAAEEFDLNSVSNRGAADGALPQLPAEYDEAIAPAKNSYFSQVFQNVRDFVSPIVEKGRATVIEELRDITLQNVNEVRDTIISGVFDGDEGFHTAESMVKKYFDDSYKDPVRGMVSSAFDSTVGGVVNEAAVDISRTVATSLGLPSQGGGLVGALTDVAVKNGAEKLSDYARETFVDRMSTKVSEAYRSISERLVGPSDPVTQPVQDAALLRLPGLVSKMGSPLTAIKAINDYGSNMVNAMDEMFDRLIKSEFFGTAPPDPDPNK
jgi:hypothetical protein